MGIGTRTRRLLRTRIGLGLLAGAALAFAIALALFEPWKLWVDATVVQALPAVVAGSAPESVDEAVEAQAVVPAVTTQPVVEYRGELISHEHETRGTVRVLRLPDGSRVLRLDDLDTSNGPDLKVLLSDAGVRPGRAGWRVFDDGANRSLGSLKGNRGAQNYPLPADVDPADFRSVSIWCDRFNVSFGAAELTAVAQDG